MVLIYLKNFRIMIFKVLPELAFVDFNSHCLFSHLIPCGASQVSILGSPHYTNYFNNKVWSYLTRIT